MIERYNMWNCLIPKDEVMLIMHSELWVGNPSGPVRDTGGKILSWVTPADLTVQRMPPIYTNPHSRESMKMRGPKLEADKTTYLVKLEIDEHTKRCQAIYGPKRSTSQCLELARVANNWRKTFKGTFENPCDDELERPDTAYHFYHNK
jgi:hypothetical protein